MLLLWVDGWDPAGQQAVHVGPDLVGLCAREGVKDAPAPGKKKWEKSESAHPKAAWTGFGAAWDRMG